MEQMELHAILHFAQIGFICSTNLAAINLNFSLTQPQINQSEKKKKMGKNVGEMGSPELWTLVFLIFSSFNLHLSAFLAAAAMQIR